MYEIFVPADMLFLDNNAGFCVRPDSQYIDEDTTPISPIPPACAFGFMVRNGIGIVIVLR